uniref:Uncharacterized protein n=1 Tax=Klebsiella pneumoniae TaxID=573 RepID=A0A6G9HPX9_KLEPN|nr:hypothetical protein [Klebsiella pneumoniae]
MQMSGGEREIFFGLMKRSGMAGKNLLRKALPSPGTRGRETALPRRVPAVLRRHGESGATGTVAASAAVDLDVRHQTLAARPETA